MVVTGTLAVIVLVVGLLAIAGDVVGKLYEWFGPRDDAFRPMQTTDPSKPKDQA